MNTGTHRARATAIELGYTKNGTEQAAISLQITEGEAQGESIAYYAFFSDKAQKFAINALRALGWTGDDLSKLTVEDLPAECQIVVGEEEYEGQKRLKVKWVNALGSGVASCKDKMSDAQRAEFGQRMRGMCLESKPAGAPKATPKPAPVASPAGPVDPDDLPF